MSRRVGSALSIVVAVAVVAAPRAARAATTCNVVTVSSLAFGTYDPYAPGPLDSTATLSYKCPPGPKVTISIDAGSSGSFTARTLRSGASVLLYNVYTDAARTAIWGDGTPPSAIGPGATTASQGVTVATMYGRIPAGQDVGVGDYTDAVVVTFNF